MSKRSQEGLASRDPSKVIPLIQEAVEAERRAVEAELGQLGDHTVRVLRGRRIHPEPGAHVYCLECVSSLTIPEGAQVSLESPGVLASGEAIKHDEDADQLWCVFKEDLDEELPECLLRFNSTYLLSLLSRRLQAIAEQDTSNPFNTELALALLYGEQAASPAADLRIPQLAPAQEYAVRFAATQSVTYLWGPPGTGKTQTVGHLVHTLLDRGERVLLTAHTNIATDNALHRVLTTASVSQDQVIRLGYHADSLKSYGVGLDFVVDRAIRRYQSDLAAGIQSVCDRVKVQFPTRGRSLSRGPAALPRLLRTAKGIVTTAPSGHEGLVKEIAELSKLVEDAEIQALSNARLVATTLTKCYTSKLLRDFRTDTLIVDEASMASIALAFVAACFARRRAIAVGDFRQLPTIVKADTQPSAQYWLGSHVFKTAQCDQVDVDHPLRVMLDTQFRMHPQVGALVSRMFYGGKLKTAQSVTAAAPKRPAVLLLDTGGLECRTEQGANGSKTNMRSAKYIAKLVAAVRLDGKDIAVITPYRAHVRAIREAIREIRPQLLLSERIEVFTVHRFQGRDKQVVIFDTTEAPGTACWFLNELENPDAPNLVNVAISRAREKLMIVGDFEYLTSALSSDSMLNRTISCARALEADEAEAGHAADESRIGDFLTDGM